MFFVFLFFFKYFSLRGDISHLLHKPLQLVGELAEVAGGNESEPTFLQTVAGQLNYLVVSEAEHAICQGEDALGRVAADDVLYPFFHLSGGLECEKQKGALPFAGRRLSRPKGRTRTMEQCRGFYLRKALLVDMIHHYNFMVITGW